MNNNTRRPGLLSYTLGLQQQIRPLDVAQRRPSSVSLEDVAVPSSRGREHLKRLHRWSERDQATFSRLSRRQHAAARVLVVRAAILQV